MINLKKILNEKQEILNEDKYINNIRNKLLNLES